MIALQSGIAAADTHDIVSNHSQHQHTTFEFDEEKHDEAHEKDCALCMHCHCTHIIAIMDVKDIEVYSNPDAFHPLLFVTMLADYSATMFRPPKS